MTNAKVMQQFIDGIKDEGHNTTQSIFFEGDVVYSYGYHFPLGIKYDGMLIVNSDGYSNTTAKHKNELLSAQGYTNIIYAPTEAMKELKHKRMAEFEKLALEYHNELTEEAKTKLSRVRSDRMAEFWVGEIETAHQQIELIVNLK